VPRGGSLGAAWYLPEERQITTKEQMLDEMCAALGGRAAEEIIFGKVSTGALSDLEKITKQAYAMVSVYGLNDKIGNISYYDSSGQSEYSFSKPYSEKTGQIIDEEVSKMVEEAYVRTKQILADNKDKLALLAKNLLEKEVIYKDDLESIFGERSFGEKSRVDTLLEENEEAQANEKSKSAKAIKDGENKAIENSDSETNSEEEEETEEKSTPKEEKAE
jgi:cell division protease FtsH